MPAKSIEFTDFLARRSSQLLQQVGTDRTAVEAELTALLDEAERIVHEQPSNAAEVAEACERLAGEAEFTGLRARASYLLARIHAERGELESALILIERARKWWLDAGVPVAAMRTILGRMQVLDDLGRHTEAAAAGESLLIALDSFVGTEDERSLCRRLRATALNNLGATLCLIGDHERSLDSYAQAEAAYNALGLRTETAQPLANRGIGLLALGRPRDALTVLRAAAEIFGEVGDRVWEAKCGAFIAQGHQQLGELVTALEVLQNARVTLEALDVHSEVARLEVATAGVYLAAGCLREARTEAEGAVESTTRLGLPHDNAIAIFTLALVLLASGDLDGADHHLRIAADRFSALGDSQYWARVLLGRADLAAKRGELGEASARAADAAAELRSGGWLIPFVWARLREADVADPERQLAILRYVDDLVDDLRIPDLRYAHRLRLARAHRQKDPQRAERLFREAVAAGEQLGANLADPKLSVAVRADKLEAHDELVDLLVQQERPCDLSEAVRISDRAKARTLIDMVAGTVGVHSRPALGLADSTNRRARYRTDLSATYNALAAAVAPSLRESLQQQAKRLEDKIDALEMREIAADPSASRRSITDLSDVGSEHRGATLAFHVVGPDVIAFVVRGGVTHVRRLPGARTAVTAMAAQMFAQWSRLRMGPAFVQRNETRLIATTKHDLQALYTLLFAPVADLLDDLDTDELAIVPHRELHQIPFHALYDGVGYLNDRWTISLRPTVGRKTAPSRRLTATRGEVVVLAVPDDAAPAIAMEAEAIAAAMPNSYIAVGDCATSEALRQRAPGAAILHLACHGIYRPANPMFSSLRLADRWVSASEILELDLDGALITLSACESGRSGHDAAEPVGLAWAFLAAGASGALVSQWIVDDDSTAGAMAAFYERLAVGDPPALALRRARVVARDRTPHPFHWAPFVYVASPLTAQIGAP